MGDLSNNPVRGDELRLSFIYSENETITPSSISIGVISHMDLSRIANSKSRINCFVKNSFFSSLIIICVVGTCDFKLFFCINYL